jgi:hypothetical protein
MGLVRLYSGLHFLHLLTLTPTNLLTLTMFSS